MNDGVGRRLRVLRGLIETFKRNGFEGASLSQLSDATGLARASLYHRFPDGKPGMGKAALAEEGKRFTDLILRPLQQGGSGAQRLAAMLAGVESFYAEGPAACLMNTLTLGEGETLFSADIAHTIEAWSRAMTAALVQDGRSPEAAREQAEDVVVRVQGALVVARLGGGRGVLHRVLVRIADDLGVVPPPAARPVSPA